MRHPILTAEFARAPFDMPDSVTRLYCNECGRIFELNVYQLTQYLGMAGCLNGTEYSVEAFDSKKTYILAFGCHVCCEAPRPTVAVIQD